MQLAITDVEEKFSVSITKDLKHLEIEFVGHSKIKILIDSVRATETLGDLYLFWTPLQLSNRRNHKEVEKWENGNVKVVKPYKRYRLNGQFIEYYKDGRTKTQGLYRDGEKVGRWTYYRNDGEKIEVDFVQDKQIVK